MVLYFLINNYDKICIYLMRPFAISHLFLRFPDAFNVPTQIYLVHAVNMREERR